MVNRDNARHFFLDNLRKLVLLCFGTGKFFILTLFSLVSTALITLSIPLCLKFLIDSSLKNDQTLWLYIGFAILVFALAVATALRYYSVSLTGEIVYHNLRTKVFKHLLTFSIYELDKLKTSDILSRMLSDAEIVRDFTGASLSVAARNLLLLIGGLVMMLYTGATLTLAALMIILLVLFPVVTLGKRVKNYTKIAQEKLVDANAVIDETLSGLTTIQNFNQENHTYSLFNSLSQISYDTSKKRIILRSCMTFIVIAFVFSAVLCLLVYGSFSVKNGTMTAGELAQFILYAVFTAGATGSLSEVMGAAQKARVAYDRLLDILNITPQITTPEKPRFITNPITVALEKVSFKYPSRENDIVISDLNISFKPQTKTALIGSSGSGKTTILKLLMRELNPNSGDIMWNNHSIHDYAPSDLRQQISYVSQNITLFSETIYHNILYANPTATQEQIINITKKVNLHDDILNMEKGYNTHIGQHGLQLSGGQRQKMALARAMLKNSPIWILDEPTSAMDTKNISSIIHMLDELTKQKTVITVTHNLSILHEYDMIFVIDKGKIIEAGTHKQLLQIPQSKYSNFVELQAFDK